MVVADAKPIARRNEVYHTGFPILDADGDLVAGATGLDSEVSTESGGFADASGEAVEETTSSGMYELSLTAAEMDGNLVMVIVKSNEGKTTPMVFYPQELGDIQVDVDSWLGVAPLALTSQRVVSDVGNMQANVLNAAAINAAAFTTAKFAADFLTAALIANGAIDAATFAAGAIDAAAIANAAIDAATFAAGAIDATAIAANAIGASQIAVGAIAADAFVAGAIDAAAIAVGAIAADAFAAGAIDAAAIATNAIDADALAADAIDLFWDEAIVEATAIPAATASFRLALSAQFALAFNEVRQTATVQTLRNRADALTIGTAAVTDDATTATRDSYV